MAAFIDLMSFANGAELANQRNWQDVTNDINTRNAEERLRQSQITFDTGLPIAQLGAETALDQGLGARRGTEFQVGVLSEMNKLPPEQQAEFLANSFRNRLSNLAATPGGAQELNALRDMVTMQANKFLTAGDTRSAQALYAALPGGDQARAGQVSEVEKWSNPQTAADPMNIATAAAQLNARYDPQTNSVLLPNGVKLDTLSFAQFMRETATNRLADRTPGMIAQQNKQTLSDYGDKLVEDYRQNGIFASKNPITGVVSPLFNLKDGMPIQQPVQQPGGMQQPVQQVAAMPLPGATGPTLVVPTTAANQIPTGGYPTVPPGQQAYGFLELLQRMLTPPAAPQYNSGYRNFGTGAETQIPTGAPNWMTTPGTAR